MTEKSTAYSHDKRYVELKTVRQNSKQQNTLITVLNSHIIFLHLVAFLLGRAGILENLTPFGIAFFAASLHKNKKYGQLGLTTLLGIMTVQGFFKSLPYAMAMVWIYILFQYVVNLKKAKIYRVAFLSALTYAIAGMIFLTFQTFYLYDAIMVSFEALVIFVVIYITSYAIPIVLQGNQRRLLATEEIICVAIVTALMLSGVKEIQLFGFSLRNILGILLTILFAYNGGASVGAAVGVTLGLITSMSASSIPPVVIGIFAFSGLLAGIFRDMGKFGSALGFLMGNGILTFYINGYYEIFLQFEEIIGAFILFLILPNSWIQQLEKFCSTRTSLLQSNKTHSERIQKMIYGKLHNFSATFEELSATFDNIAEKSFMFQQEDLSNMVERIAESTCKDCGMKRNCWENNFYTTYQGLMDLMLLIETKDQIHYDLLPEEMKSRCLRLKQITEKLIHLYDINQLNMEWKKRLIESRQLVGEQLKGVSKVLEGLAKEINGEIEFDMNLEESIYVALDKAGLTVKEILVSDGEKGKLEIHVEKNPCYGREHCIEKYLPVISEAVGVPLVKKNGSCDKMNRNQDCCFTLVQANKYATATKIARMTKNGNQLSGDTYTFMDLNNGQYMLALSDGMGTGEKAYIQSNATISMLEKMMEAGFDREIAIKTINSMLMLKSSEEMFSSVDMALIDLYFGKADFVKIGSAPSFIKRRDGSVQIITSSTLPIGILPDIQIDENIEKLKDGDFVIMVSDGILEANKEKGDQWITDLLFNFHTRNPQELADKILQTALRFSGNKAQDDMTVMVTKIWEVRDW